MNALQLLAAWFVVSVPAAVAVGTALNHGAQRERSSSVMTVPAPLRVRRVA